MSSNINNVLISFVGGTDLREANNPNSPSGIIQLLNYIKPSKAYIFYTPGLKEEFDAVKFDQLLKSNYPDINFTFHFKEQIYDPTDMKQIYTSIDTDLRTISNLIVENKTQGFVNIASGTPQIQTVLSLSVITGLLERSHGIYPPNPKHNAQIKIDALDFFKTSLGFETVKLLIQKYDYSSLLDLLKDKYYNKKLKNHPEIISIIDFAHCRFTSDFDKAKQIYSICNELQTITPEINKDSPFHTCIERYYTIPAILDNENHPMATIWVAIIRETLLEFFCDEFFPDGLSQITLKIDDDDKIKKKRLKQESQRRKFNTEIIHREYPDFVDFMNQLWKKDHSGGFSFDRELSQNTFKMIFEYICYYYQADEKKRALLNSIKNNIQKLDSVVGKRNQFAHSIVSGKFESSWLTVTQNLLQETANLLDEEIDLGVNPYDELNKFLLKKIETLFLY